MRPILCATDYSKNSLPALKLGHVLSKKMEVPLVVLHVFDINVALVTPLSMTFARMQKEAFEKHLRRLTQLCENHLGLLPDDQHLKIMVKENALIIAAIREAIEESDAMMVFMGMKGVNALKDTIMGSSTQNMIGKSPCPVVAVPSVLKGYDVKTITYATDFEERDIHAIDWVVKTFGRSFNPHLNVVHIGTKEEYAGAEQMEWFKEMLQQKIAYNNISYEFIADGKVFKGLQSHLENTGSDLVVMLEREHEGLIKSLTHSDRVKLMASKGKIPLISIEKNIPF